jgi:ABC-type proline/glycine betaine transport system ATPase subunit
VIIVTHDMAEAFALGRRIGVIDGGQLVVCDTPGIVAASSDPRVRVFVDTLPFQELPAPGQPAVPTPRPS